jgi:D-alanyl-D-alanine carboxypeptidase
VDERRAGPIVRRVGGIVALVAIVAASVAALGLAVTAPGAGSTATPTMPGATGAGSSPTSIAASPPGQFSPPAATPTHPATATSSPSPPTSSPTQSPSASATAPAPPGPVDSWIARRLQAALDRSAAAIGTPGAAAAVILGDGRTWSGGTGLADVARETPMTGSTVFSIASMGKPLVAVVTLELIREGRLGLDDSVAAHLPDLELLGSPIDSRITIHQLLDHTSGLADFLTSPALAAAVEAAPSRRWTAEEALAYLRPPIAAPGERYAYSNTNYLLLGLVIEQVTGNSVAQEVRARVSEPLGLSTLFYQGLDPVPGTLAVAYRFASSRLTATPTDVTDPSGIRPFAALTTASGAAGSFAASPEDLARAYRGIFSGSLVGADLVARMVLDTTRPTAILPAAPYGLGVQVYQVDGWTTFGHSGRLVGAQGVTRFIPALGVTISVLTNQSRYDPASIFRALLAEVAPLQGPTKAPIP